MLACFEKLNLVDQVYSIYEENSNIKRLYSHNSHIDNRLSCVAIQKSRYEPLVNDSDSEINRCDVPDNDDSCLIQSPCGLDFLANLASKSLSSVSPRSHSYNIRIKSKNGTLIVNP